MRYWLIILLALSGTLRASENESNANELLPTDTEAVAREKLKRQHCLVMKELADEIEKYTEGRITCEQFMQKFNKAAPEGTWLINAKIGPESKPSKFFSMFAGQRFSIELTGVITDDPGRCRKISELEIQFSGEFGVPERQKVPNPPECDGTPSNGTVSKELDFIDKFHTRFDSPWLQHYEGGQLSFECFTWDMEILFEVMPIPKPISLPRRAASSHSYPLWNGEESTASYADSAKLPPTKTVAIGGGEQIEFVLIPAGEFTMGTPPAPEMQVAAYEKQMYMGATLAVVSALWLAIRLCIMVVHAVMKRQRPTYSLFQWMAFVVIAGVTVIGFQQWWFTARKLERYRVEIPAIAKRLKYSDEKERPAHKVTITTPFYMSKYPITQEQYFQVTNENGSKIKGNKLPADSVSWDQAQGFCQELNSRGPLRLPTEAEWEFACHAGTASAFYTGDNEADLASAGWYSANSGGSTHPVGTKPPNAFGLYDMHGNVRQWCEDVLAPYPDHAVFDPRNPGGGEHVLRGGSWYSTPERCRSTYRSSCNAIGQYDVVGFRVVMDVE